MIPYYEDDLVQLFLGRCEDVMPTLVPESFGMVLADLPYGTTRNEWDRELDAKMLWWHYNQLVPERAAVVLFGAGLFTATMMLSNQKAWKYNLVWDKQAVTGFLNAKKQPLRAHEDLLVFYRAQPYYAPQMVQTGRKSHSRGNKADRVVNHYNEFVNTAVPEEQDGQYPRSILSFKREKTGWHPTQKPVALCEFLIKSYCPPGTTVLDNVSGSATTLVAAARTGRRGVGIEVREDYCEKAAQRLQDEATLRSAA